MKLKKFLSDIKDLKQEDFDFARAFTCRKTGMHTGLLFGVPLEKVLLTHKVCILGYLYAKKQLNGFEEVQAYYTFKEKQLNSLTMPQSKVKFESGLKVITPNADATLKEVMEHIKLLISNEEWLTGKFKM